MADVSMDTCNSVSCGVNELAGSSTTSVSPTVDVQSADSCSQSVDAACDRDSLLRQRFTAAEAKADAILKRFPASELDDDSAIKQMELKLERLEQLVNRASNVRCAETELIRGIQAARSVGDLTEVTGGLLFPLDGRVYCRVCARPPYDSPQSGVIRYPLKAGDEYPRSLPPAFCLLKDRVRRHWLSGCHNKNYVRERCVDIQLVPAEPPRSFSAALLEPPSTLSHVLVIPVGGELEEESVMY